jgi:hypothetical protein
MSLPASFWHAGAPIFGLAANVASQVLLCRFARTSLLRSVVVGFGVGVAVTAGIDLWAMPWAAGPKGEQFLLLAFNTLLVGTLGYGYFHFVNLGETARRTRIMRELLSAPEGLTQEELLSRYNAREMVANRLRRLIAKQQIEARDGRLFVKKTPMLYISLAMTQAKWLVIGKKSEFD